MKKKLIFKIHKNEFGKEASFTSSFKWPHALDMVSTYSTVSLYLH